MWSYVHPNIMMKTLHECVKLLHLNMQRFQIKQNWQGLIEFTNECQNDELEKIYT
jgi:hypothetical protein